MQRRKCNPMLKLIAAISKNYQIGLNGKMPWHLPQDLTYFKNTTLHHPVVMGHKTYNSIGHPLPGRRNIVLSRDTHLSLKGVEVFHEPYSVLALSQETDVFIIGGGELYKLFLPFADVLHLTLIDAEFKGDTSFPSFKSDFRCTFKSETFQDPTSLISFNFTEWTRL